MRSHLLLTATLSLACGASAVAAEELRLSHQWSTNDVRHKVAQIVADEVAAADVDLDIKIFPSESLFKAREQYTPLSARPARHDRLSAAAMPADSGRNTTSR